MSKLKDGILLPDFYVPLLGSERPPSIDAKLLGPADAEETIRVTIVMRRRTDGPAFPDFDYFANTPPSKHKRLSQEEFAGKYGAHQDDINKVIEFAGKSNLKVIEIHAARRTVLLSGTIAQMNSAFKVILSRFEHKTISLKGKQGKSEVENYRGRDGFIHIPKDLTDIIIGVFGLDNRGITKRNYAGDPQDTKLITVEQMAKLYHFPTNSAKGQAIGIVSEGGYHPADINSTFSGNPPKIIPINVNATNDESVDDIETTQDICIAAAAAPGADIIVYFTTDDQGGWVNMLNRVVHPEQGDPECFVLSSSFYVLDSDDFSTLPPVSKNWIDTVNMLFQDAAMQKITICVSSGDKGTDSKIGDGRAHVQYPATDPWVLSVGGTTVGNIKDDSFEEWVWNDVFKVDHTCATGGGISGYFPKPSYQNKANVPPSLNDGHSGRGVPDVAGNASPNSGFPVILGGKPNVGCGTSASAPLWAGLITLINAALGEPLGFINPHIYNFGSKAFRDITGAEGPKNNGLNKVPGYPAKPGWDACTGWGSPNGVALLNEFKKLNG
ncbi:MAG TPA: S53 family peptidase [Bacteroidia bacterium]|nr:S53 family peptidase [Bacteroidia bacterium]